MEKVTYEQLLRSHGKKVKAKVLRVQLSPVNLEGKISVEGNDVYICFNDDLVGFRPKDMLGYSNSWQCASNVNTELKQWCVYDFEFTEE